MCVPISCAIWTSWSPITLTVTPSTLARGRPARRVPESRRIPSASTCSSWPGRTSVVESSSSITAGPRSTRSGRQILAPVDRASRARRRREADVAHLARRRQVALAAVLPARGRAPGPSAATFAWISSIVSPGKL